MKIDIGDVGDIYILFITATTNDVDDRVIMLAAFSLCISPPTQISHQCIKLATNILTKLSPTYVTKIIFCRLTCWS